MGRSYTLNEYFPYADESIATRAEVYADNDTAVKVLAYHKDKGAVEISLSNCVNENASELPMPSELMSALDAKIKSINCRVIITGIDAYLLLINDTNVNSFMIALRSRIDAGKLNAVYMVSKMYFDFNKFSNPKYEDMLSVVYVIGGMSIFEQVAVTVVSDQWVRAGMNPTNWKELLVRLGQFVPTDDSVLVLNNYKNKQAGLSERVTQLLEIENIAEKYYGISQQLPKTVLEELIKQCKEQNSDPLDVLRSAFGISNTNTRHALKRLLELQAEELWPAYVWYVQKFVESNSYLECVLANNVTKDNLLRRYVLETATKHISNDNAARLAAERANGIKELGTLADSLIIEFIGEVIDQPDDIVAPWLNCGTQAERIEIVRRVAKSDLTIGLSKIWRNLYPALADYLSDEFDYGAPMLTEYFREYCRQKVKNVVTQEFVKKAFDSTLPAFVAVRDSELQDLLVDTNAALLVVDGMGAEYFPLMLSMAKRRGFNILSSMIASVRLPSSTDFNHIRWDKERFLKPTVHEIDNISHNGAKKYEQCSPWHNIVATFAVFEDVFNRIASALRTFERVVVSADHGSSRLAVLAYEQKLINNLSWIGEPEDWRFAIAPANTKRSPEFEFSYDAERDINYWIVRGYNRLPKKGGKLSVHGGATFEERLVPIIVFSKIKVADIQESVNNPITEQLVEKAGFGFDDI